MIRLLLALLFAIPTAAEATGPFDEPNLLVVEASLTSLTRTDNPFSLVVGDRIQVFNGCGYDTAIVSVRRVLRGDYEDTELAANLTLGEFCQSFLQPSVRDYLLVLAWNGSSWQIQPELSSALLSDDAGNQWVVNPELLALVASSPKALIEDVQIPTDILELIAMEHFDRIGILEFAAGLDEQQRVAELRRLEANDAPSWSGNPLFFTRGVRLPVFRDWLQRQRTELPIVD